MLFPSCFDGGRPDGTMVTKPRVVPKEKYGTLKPDRALRASNSTHLSCSPEGVVPGQNARSQPWPKTVCLVRWTHSTGGAKDTGEDREVSFKGSSTVSPVTEFSACSFF